MAEGKGRVEQIHIDAMLNYHSDSSDFGLGYLLISLLQGIECKNILNLWDRFRNDDRRSILEETLRELPMSHFIWFEKLLDYLEYRRERRMTGGRHWFSESSPALFRVFVKILTTPGHEPGSLIRQDRYTLYNPYHTVNSHSAWWAGWRDWQMSVGSEFYKDLYSVDVKTDGGCNSDSDAEWLRLQKKVQELPLDISRMIQDSMYESVFGPKDVVLPYVDPKDLCHFSALNSELYDKYFERYYSKNMWILADGPPDEIERCFQCMPQRTRLAIRNLTIRWTKEDIDVAEWLKLDADRFLRTQIEEGGAEGLDNMSALHEYSFACWECCKELKTIWRSKAYELRSLDLDLLIVDATDAYGPNEEFLGLEFAREFPRFDCQIPYDLRVFAPNDEFAQQIYDCLVARW